MKQFRGWDVPEEKKHVLGTIERRTKKCDEIYDSNAQCGLCEDCLFYKSAPIEDFIAWEEEQEK